MLNKAVTKVSFYVVAHADDWQLFMFPNGYKDLVASDCKTIIIITTAGDAGREEVYWRAREEGIKSSLLFCLAPLGVLSQSNGSKEFNGHNINYWSINNTVCYFLRLPDGNLDGKGFSTFNFQSLTKFKSGELSTLATVDKATTYHNWPDFYKTLQMIILSETVDLSCIWVNYLNPDADTNPHDHADHIATGQALQAMPIITSLQQALYTGYNIGNTLGELHPADLFWKMGMFAAYEKAVFDSCGYSTLQEGIQTYIKWCLKSAHFSTVAPNVQK